MRLRVTEMRVRAHRDRPLAVALREGGRGTTTAFVAAEMERIQIAPESSGDSRRRREQAAQALASIPGSVELWQVAATRGRPDPDGSSVRFGWVCLGRAASGREAVAIAWRAMTAVSAIQTSFAPFAETRPVERAEALVDLLRPAAAPFLCTLRRRRWEPRLLVEAEPKEAPSLGGRPPGTYLAWAADDLPWAPMMEALASNPHHAGLVVRILTGVRAPEHVVRDAEIDLLAISREQGRLMGAPLRKAAPLPKLAEQLLDAAASRHEVLSQPCLAADATLASWSPGVDALKGIFASSVRSSVEPSRRKNGDSCEEPPRRSAIDLVALPEGALWEPVDLRADSLVDVSEASALFRTPEPPVDERSPLPASRARVLSLRVGESAGTLLGDAERGTRPVEARIDDQTRFKHVYLVGQTGTGKSTLLLRMALEDIRAGHGVTVLDPHGTLIDEILLRLPNDRRDDVILVDPSDPRYALPLNPFVLTAGGEMYKRHRDRVVDEMLDTFEALYDMRLVAGPMFEQYFRTFSTLLIGSCRPDDYVPMPLMLEILMGSAPLYRGLASRLDAADEIARSALENIVGVTENNDQSLRNMIPYVTSKLVRFYAPLAARRMLCQPDCLDLGEVIASRRILLVQLAPVHVGSEAAALIARQVILRLSIAAMERGTDPDAPPHFIYADECHNFATERFAALLAEARKFRLGLVLAHQYTSQLVKRQDTSLLDAILGNVGTVIAFRLGPRDAALLERVMAPRATESDLSGQQSFVAIARSVGDLGNVPFTLRTRPAPPPEREDLRALRDAALAAEGRDGPSVDAWIAQEIARLRSI